MVELVATRASIVGCFAEPEALDALERTDGAHACRVAPDEVMLVGEAGAAEELVRLVAENVTASDADAAVLDTTDGWSIWSLVGDGARDAFAKLSELELCPEGFAQGDVAHVPTRVIAEAERLHLLVPAMWGAYMRERILALGVREIADGGTW